MEKSSLDGQEIKWQEIWEYMIKNLAKLWCGLLDLSGN
uniref:Uncharacterized protein n=1 Tax=Anguilla anguilla TaxID=7936 RepID=A0A0E9PDN7_ANGAN